MQKWLAPEGWMFVIVLLVCGMLIGVGDGNWFVLLMLTGAVASILALGWVVNGKDY